MSIFLSFFFWAVAGRFIQPVATVFGQFRLRVCFKNNLNCKFPPYPSSSGCCCCFSGFYLFYFFRFLHEANEAWRCVCGNCCKLIWNYMHGNECAKCMCVSVCLCNLICVATIKCNLRLAGHLEVWVGDEEPKNSVNFERKRERENSSCNLH